MTNRKRKQKKEQEKLYLLVWNFPLLLVRLNKHARITYEMRVPFGQNDLHSLRVYERNKPEHSLLLVRNPYILHWPKLASNQ